ncbi:MAG: hypothetical protein U0528_14305 [Anaerolineae bacterium]
MRGRIILFVTVTIALALLVLILSFEMLPAAPGAPTPTFPMGIDLPEKLPRIPR